MKILLPAGFIALKLTGTFIDFMLGLANSNVQEDTEITTAKVRDSRFFYIENFVFLILVQIQYLCTMEEDRAANQRSEFSLSFSLALFISEFSVI